LGEKLVERALSLARMPQRFAFYEERRGIRKMPGPPFLLFYTCDESLEQNRAFSPFCAGED
jgi:hypothetical protein